MTGLNHEALETLMLKEQALSNIIVWLKAKGLYEDCAKDCGLPPLKKEEHK